MPTQHCNKYEICKGIDVSTLKGREKSQRTHHYTNVKCYEGGYLYHLILFYSQLQSLINVVFTYLHIVYC